WPATVPSAGSGPSRAGYLPVSEPPWARPAAAPASTPAPAVSQAPAASQASAPTSVSRPADAPLAPAAFTPRREDAARGVWEWRDDSIQVPSAPAPGQSSAPPRPAAPSPPAPPASGAPASGT